MQGDCNLVLYDATKPGPTNAPSQAIWASNTWLEGQTAAGCSANVGTDGKLCVNRPSSGNVWCSSIGSPIPPSSQPVIYVAQDDGNFIGYQCDAPFWFANSWTAGASFRQVIPSLNPNWVHPQDVLEAFERKCFGTDLALCAEAAKDEIVSFQI
jgi:hypothetical protein